MEPALPEGGETLPLSRGQDRLELALALVDELAHPGLILVSERSKPFGPFGHQRLDLLPLLGRELELPAQPIHRLHPVGTVPKPDSPKAVAISSDGTGKPGALRRPATRLEKETVHGDARQDPDDRVDQQHQHHHGAGRNP
jgi:hypothetical protein